MPRLIALGITCALLAGCARTGDASQLLPTRTVGIRTPAPQPIVTIAGLNPCGPRSEPLTKAAGTSASGGRIALTSPAGNVQLYNPVDGTTSDVTTDADTGRSSGTMRQYKFPMFSRDGTKLAYTGVALLAGTFNPTQTVHVAEVGSARSSLLYVTTQQNIPYLDWSPDGASVAVLSIDAAGGDIHVLPATGGAATKFDSGSTVYWDWQPGKNILTAHLGGSMGLNPAAYLSQGEAAAAKPTRMAQRPGNFQSPHYSPDGSALLYVAESGGKNVLVLADAAGKPECRIANVDQGAFFAWSPNGRYIAHIDTASPVFEPSELSIHDVRSGKSTRGTEPISAFFWSPGNRLLTVSVDEASDALTVSAGKLVTQVLPAPLSVLAFSVVEAETGATRPVGRVLPTRDFVQLLGFFDQYSRAMTPWSPNGNQFVFTAASASGGAPFGVLGTLGAGGTFSTSAPFNATLAMWSPR